MPATRHIQRVVHTEDLVGESPIWCPQEQALYWVDVRGCWLHRWEPETGLRHDWPMPDVIGCIALREGGGLLVAQGVSLCTFDIETGALEVFATLEEGRSDLRINDGACDPQGRMWVGTMTHNFGGPGGSDVAVRDGDGSLFRVDADGSFRHFNRAQHSIPNTVAWSPDGQTVWFGDSTPRTIHAYDYNAEGLPTNQTLFYAFEPRDAGVPDGSTVDEEGYLWNARWGGGCVVRHHPDGTVVETIPLPVLQPACCVLGGKERTTLYITTARDGLSPEQLEAQPWSGSVLAVEVDVPGVLKHRFAG